MRTLIQVEGLSGGYGSKPAVTGLDFEVGAGERIAILGPNGGGKTTLIKTLTGELEPLSGRIASEVRCAVVPQTDRSRLDYPVSALDVAKMGSLSNLPWWRRPGRTERKAAAAALERVGIAGLSDRTYGELSGGQRQRTLIARALVEEAPVLLLDEPFSGLDTTAAAGLEALITDLAAEGNAILIATHDLRQAKRWDKVLCLNRRQIAFGTPDDSLTESVLEQTYGAEIVSIGEGNRGIVPPHHHDHGDA